MILFHNSTTSTTMSVLVLFLTFLGFLLSTFLNPTVFIYNRKKTSIAGLLFCIISATDFITCIYYPTLILYYASTIDLSKMTCNPEHKQPQNCISNATLTNKAFTIGGIALNVTVLLTTSILAIIRSIQIRYPFYRVRKLHVLVGLILLAVSQFFLWSFNTLSPLSDSYFFPSHTGAVATNPYGVESLKLRKIFLNLQNLPFIIAQGLAVIASLVTAVTLFMRRNVAGSNANRNRVIGATKVILTNVPSFVYLTIFCTPIVLVISQFSDDLNTPERHGWHQYIVFLLLPMMSSIWNPIVFVSLTPKSRESLRSLIYRKRNITQAAATTSTQPTF